MRKIFKKGFTIAEIVVVIGVMTLLTTLVYTSLDGSKRQSRDQKRVADISSVQLALEQFYARNRFYPPTLSGEFNKYIYNVPDGINYAPIKPIILDQKCGSYHLYITLESRISALDYKKGFNSTSVDSCVTTPDKRINASSSPLIYDVIP